MAMRVVKSLISVFPSPLRETIGVNLFGMVNVPALFFCRPKVMSVTDDRLEVKIPLSRRTKNHVKSMYFGVLAVGADVTGGMLAMRHSDAQKANVTLLFKDFQIDFHRRALGDVHFVCEDGPQIGEAVRQCVEQDKRVNIPVAIKCFVPSEDVSDPVASAVLTLSLKPSKRGMF
eukprot:TRINITY_DN12991_c0_g1_i1.p2 TRINITY_DN12991_c0_g1~~TRINITY_DN12991_c0_g1_i1.p2  ORF type:complete len:174 (-),score=21.02 TRINITY_DN12991_c0_g1_i1:61-582(-)